MAPCPPRPAAATLALLVLLGGCASAPRRPSAPEGHRPVLFFHGIDEHPASFAPLMQRLRDAGWRPEELAAARLSPSDPGVLTAVVDALSAPPAPRAAVPSSP